MNPPSDALPTRADKQVPGLWSLAQLVMGGVLLLCAGILLDGFLFTGMQLPGSVRLLLVGFLLAGLVRCQGWLLLIAMQAILFINEPAREQLGWSTFFLCAFMLLFMAASLSLKSWGSTRWNQLTELFVQLLQPSATQAQKEYSNTSWWSRHGSWHVAMGRLLASALAAVMVFGILPLTGQARQVWLQSSLANENVLWPGPSLLVGLGLLLVVLREFSWKNLNAAQASLWLRSSFIQGNLPDLRMILRRRTKQLSKSLSEKGSDPFRRGQKNNEIDSPPKGQTPFRIGSK